MSGTVSCSNQSGLYNRAAASESSVLQKPQSSIYRGGKNDLESHDHHHVLQTWVNTFIVYTKRAATVRESVLSVTRVGGTDITTHFILFNAKVMINIFVTSSRIRMNKIVS